MSWPGRYHNVPHPPFFTTYPSHLAWITSCPLPTTPGLHHFSLHTNQPWCIPLLITYPPHPAYITSRYSSTTPGQYHFSLTPDLHHFSLLSTHHNFYKLAWAHHLTIRNAIYFWVEIIVFFLFLLNFCQCPFLFNRLKIGEHQPNPVKSATFLLRVFFLVFVPIGF